MEKYEGGGVRCWELGEKKRKKEKGEEERGREESDNNR